MTGRPLAVVLAPLPPSRTGNGLAMRLDLLVQAAALHHDVAVVVVPVAGRLEGPAPTLEVPTLELDLPPVGDRAPLVEWLADPRWRHLVDALAPVPDPVARASPVRTARVAHEALTVALGPRPVAAVIASRLTLAPAGTVLAARLSAALVVDADDDDEGLARARGEGDVADGWARLAAATLPGANAVWAAGPADAVALAARHGRPVEVVPNAAPRVEPLPPPAGRPLALLVANLTYGPNVEGAAWLVEEVLPHLPGWHLSLVGTPSARVRTLASEQVAVHGAVADLRPHYADATAVAVPLRHGAGTRIKVLEAFAYGRPVVATTVGAAGLDVADGTHLLLADDPAAFATALQAALDPARSASLVGRAQALVQQTYDAGRIAAEAGARLREVAALRPTPTDRTT